MRNYDGNAAEAIGGSGARFGGVPCFLWYFCTIARRCSRRDILVNPHTGLAFSGFDQWAYFTDYKRPMGKPEFELRLDGTIWQFHNVGNRVAFTANPEVYRPRFAGYDTVAIARGVFRSRPYRHRRRAQMADGSARHRPMTEPASGRGGTRLGRVAPGDEAGHQVTGLRLSET